MLEAVPAVKPLFAFLATCPRILTNTLLTAAFDGRYRDVSGLREGPWRQNRS